MHPRGQPRTVPEVPEERGTMILAVLIASGTVLAALLIAFGLALWGSPIYCPCGGELFFDSDKGKVYCFECGREQE